jgi:hypothetical protein
MEKIDIQNFKKYYRNNDGNATVARVGHLNSIIEEVNTKITAPANPQDGDALVYNSTSGEWESAPVQSFTYIDEDTSTGNELLEIEVTDGVDTSNVTINPAEIIISTGNLSLQNIPTYTDNAAALGAGYPVNSIYKTPTGEIRIVV